MGEAWENSPPGFANEGSPPVVTTAARPVVKPPPKARTAKRPAAGPVPTADATAPPLPAPTRFADIPADVDIGKLVSVLEALHVLRPVLGTKVHAAMARECQLPVSTYLVTSLLDGSVSGGSGTGAKGRLSTGLKALLTRLVQAIHRDWNGSDEDEDDDEAACLLDAPAAWALVEASLTELLTSAEDDDGSASEQSDVPAPRRVTRQQAGPPPGDGAGDDPAAALVQAARGGPGWLAGCGPALRVECLHWLCCEALESNAFRQALHDVDVEAKEAAKEAARRKAEVKAAQADAREAAKHLKELTSAANTASGSDAQRRAAIVQAKKAAGAAAAKADHLQAAMRQADTGDVEVSAAAAAALMRVTSLGSDPSGRQYWRLRSLEKAGLLGVSWAVDANGAVEEWGTYDAAQAARAAHSLRRCPPLGEALAAWAKEQGRGMGK